MTSAGTRYRKKNTFLYWTSSWGFKRREWCTVHTLFHQGKLLVFGWPGVPVNQKSAEKKQGGCRVVVGMKLELRLIYGENDGREDSLIFRGCMLWAGSRQHSVSAPCHKNLSFLKEKAAAHRQSINMCTCARKTEQDSEQALPTGRYGPDADTVEPLNYITSLCLCLSHPFSLSNFLVFRLQNYMRVCVIYIYKFINIYGTTTHLRVKDY